MLEKGQIFPSDIDESRIRLQNKWEQMYHSEYVYNRVIDPITKKSIKVDPLVPLPAVISEISSDLLFGEFPILEYENEQANELLQKWLDEHKQFETDLLEASAYTSALGTIFLIKYVFGDRVFYEFVSGNKCVWEEDMLGLVKFIMFKEDEVNVKQKWVIYKVHEHYYKYDEKKRSPYLDENRTHVVEDYYIKVNSITRKIMDVYDKEEVNTGLKNIPVVKVDNIRVMNSLIGKSDYQGKEQLFAEVDNRIDQINYVLQEHAEPWVGMPPGLLDNKGRFNRAYGKMFEKSVSAGDSDISIAQWNAQLEAAFQSIDTMIRMIFFSSRISPPISGMDQGGNVESGRALKWRSINTFAMINRKRKYWDEVLKRFFMFEGEMNREYEKFRDANLIITWQDGLPMDETEIVENVVKRVNAGLMSHLEAIKEMNEVDDDMAQKELDQINSEKQQKADIEASKFTIRV